MGTLRKSIEQERDAMRETLRQHLAAHMVIRADGTEVISGDHIGESLQGPIRFVRITRAPGDGSGTNGKIDVEDPSWISPLRELYPSVFGLRVVKRPGAVSPFDV
jgi:hypothetical protein